MIKYPWAQPFFLGKEQEYVQKALASTWISGGPYVDRFESEFAKLNSAPYVITTSNGTTALYLAILGLGIGLGDEVIVPGFTFVAAANMVIAAGARPVFADVDQNTWCIDPQSIEKVITKKTKAICVVHLYGNVCDMTALKSICRKHKLFLIEDTAQAALSRFNGKAAGTFGDVGTFSFHATKTIAMGEGGCVTVAKKTLFERMKVIRNHGMTRKRFYWHTAVGHNFRLPNLQAAIGCAQLERITETIAQKRRVYETYRRRLEQIDGIVLQNFKKDVQPVVWAFAFQITKTFGKNRDNVMKALLKEGIETRPGFHPFQDLPIYKEYVKSKLPVSDVLGKTTMSLPSFPQLTEKQIHTICDVLLAQKRKA
jgi:perosamine synthetase